MAKTKPPITRIPGQAQDVLTILHVIMQIINVIYAIQGLITDFFIRE
jgi:hypothetical protein